MSTFEKKPQAAPNIIDANDVTYDNSSSGLTADNAQDAIDEVAVSNGNVTGPATNSADYLPQWDGANSKKLKNGLAVPAGGLAGITALGAKADIDSPNFTTDIYSPLVLAGATAASADWPTAKVIGSQADSAHSYTGNIGVVGESVASATDTGTGVGGVSVTNGANESRGVTGVGKIGATGDTAKANGVYGYVNGIHAGGDNIGVRGSAINGANNYSFYGENGKIYNNGDIELGHLTDTTLHRDSAGVISIEGVKIMTVGGTDTVTGTKTMSAINLPTNGQINLTLPTTDAHCTGHVTSSFQSGYTAAAGDLVFMGSASKWLEVDADSVDTCKGLLGIAMEAKNNTEAMKVALPGSMVRFDAWNWTVGATLYAGETLGAMQETIPTGADCVIRVVGFAMNADTVFFFPSSDTQIAVA